MNTKRTAFILRVILIGFALLGVGLIVLLLINEADVFPQAFKPIPLNESSFHLWIGFLCAAMVPCFAVLVLGWLIANHIKRDNTFSVENSKLLKTVGIISAVDSAFFLCSTVYFFHLGLQGSVFLISLIAAFIGVAFSIGSLVLSKLTARAADIQAENALTI